MRVTAGIYGGRILKAPPGRDTRPTSDKVRQAVFNMLNARGAVEGAYVLDVFCGTGALGIEAMSQGAASCVFIDNNREALSVCRDNLSMLQIDAKTLCVDAAKPGALLAGCPPATLAFFDPPYRKNLIPAALRALTVQGWLADGALLVMEMDAHEPFAEEKFDVTQDKTYGDTRVVLAYAAKP